MRRAGRPPAATVLAFVLATPQLNPLSLLYGLTLSEPVVIVCFVVATMLLAIAGGEPVAAEVRDAPPTRCRRATRRRRPPA